MKNLLLLLSLFLLFSPDSGLAAEAEKLVQCLTPCLEREVGVITKQCAAKGKGEGEALNQCLQEQKIVASEGEAPGFVKIKNKCIAECEGKAPAAPTRPKTAEEKKSAADAKESARVLLTRVFAASKLFYMEWGAYTSDFESIFAHESNQGDRAELKKQSSKYVIGALNEFPAKAVMAKDDFFKKYFKGAAAYNPARNLLAFPFSVKSLQTLPADTVRQIEAVCRDCKVGKESFRYFAVANLDKDPELDIWAINEKREVVHLQKD